MKFEEKRLHTADKKKKKWKKYCSEINDRKIENRKQHISLYPSVRFKCKTSRQR